MRTLVAGFVCVLLFGFLQRPSAAPGTLQNLTAYLPAQCYATTQLPGGRTRNSCATCHQDSREPNFVADAEVQTELSLPAAATTNPWTNLVTPPAPVAIDERALLAYVRTDNYRASPPASTLGYTPDCNFAPDAEGWDRDRRGERSGWRAFTYAPLPGMFWPTNGSAGDAYIRLPDAYQRTAAGTFDAAIYALNLAIVEATVRRSDVAIRATDERVHGLDLDSNGTLGTARKVAFVWPSRGLHYVGQAATLDRESAGWPAAGLYPVGTELVHSVRYLDVVGGRVQPAARMKELRYMRKLRWLSYAALDLAAKGEQREKEQKPDAPRMIFGDGERGVGTGGGWRMQGYIEAADGALRPQTREETAACIGCHGGVGASVDGTFSFARKLAGPAGWQPVQGFARLREPLRADGRGEYRAYLEATRAGDDYAANAEVLSRFFTPSGELRADKAAAIARDITTLIVPSPSRALALDRAYLAIVRAQAFAQGRDALVGTPQIASRLVQDASTGIARPLPAPWQRP